MAAVRKNSTYPGRPGVVGEQVAKGDEARTVTGSTGGNKPRQQIAEGLFKMELTALVEQHGRGGCGGDFGYACQVVDCLGGDVWGGLS